MRYLSSADDVRKVGLFLASKDSRYQRLQASDGVESARRHHLRVEVVFSENFAAQQAQDIMRFVHSNPGRPLGVVVMTVDGSSQRESLVELPVYKLARRVAARGASWIVLNREVDAQARALRQEFRSVPIGLVTPDQNELGRIQGRQFKALLPAGGRVLYVLGIPHQSSVQDRRSGMQDEISGASLEVSEVDGQWSAEKTRDAVYKWLLALRMRGRGWPSLVGCQSDEMALGARDALLRASQELAAPVLRDVPVTGVDGLPDEGQRWVAEKKLAATIVVPATSGCAIDLLAETWASGKPTPLKTVRQAVSYPSVDALAPKRALPASLLGRMGARLDLAAAAA